MTSRRILGYLLAWLIAAAVAVTVGVVAVTSVGASVRDRGPLGNDVPPPERSEGVRSPDPKAAVVARMIEDEFGRFEVECRGAVAYGLAPEPAAGWRVVSYEEGPDDDVDAVFASGDRSIEIEVYCNQGRPAVGDREVKTLPDDD
ncbi:hypothetical protein KM427_12085 [Nocardioides sp. LMS-CY]|uniref:hypothetical protein n=1 Tax=Nocardioides sp. (strain LMS-CY) TaxID=2840457 RepID=UPI001C001886|nr:hypothetical protein [Nocardioides sp. LMS-CY]QWF24364.1 hypothetical protein KM427_12085 [Nocardioides sp. LMS-CY]